MKRFFIIIFFLLLAISYFIYQKNIKEVKKSSPQNVGQKVGEDNFLPKIGPPPDDKLVARDGFKIGLFAKGLPNARDLEFSPSGTLLVSLTQPGKIVALPDKNLDGIADNPKTILSSLNKPHGIAFHDGKLYVAEEKQVTRFVYDTATDTAFFDKKLFDLPKGGRHFTRSIVFDKKGNLFIGLGSSCDTCIEDNPFISTVLTSNSEGEGVRVFSKGLRNAVFLTLSPKGSIFTTEMGRDFLGDSLPPDEIVELVDNGDYGWPFCYGNRVWDTKFGRKNKEHCNNTVSPFYEIPAHSSPLGLVFINSEQMSEWENDLLVSYHGSWNSSTPVGYKIVIIDTTKKVESDFITGFTKDKARPVDVIFDEQGSLFISDDKKGAIYKVIRRRT